VTVRGVKSLAERVDAQASAVGAEVEILGASHAGTCCECRAVGVDGTRRGIARQTGTVFKGEPEIAGEAPSSDFIKGFAIGAHQTAEAVGFKNIPQ